jgi:tRNA A58 N-methylase Trm61
VGGLAALFGHHYEAHVQRMEQILNGGIVLIVYPATAEQFEAATAIIRRHCGTDVFASSSA